ncbi:MAG: MotA/TolQ/ExbB proton channel family protein [Alphaproteobacteria bacterium]|nr:MotA/TolQ/ExbB proton channel family protein [Alphaproteobacteria bacterium]MBU0793292.1 MotA/TolQ/ExbB proton channel family protein [Alphaproteobacteria bacterium]MBU0876257.1 MotA/TolQ/ExbB proton channel family protein [Alphaproteobacteria bacterium]MBU1768182.1 MotA/TolQ/ExbB proton channel family protein [Alphaproteobacteria bacterium]
MLDILGHLFAPLPMFMVIGGAGLIAVAQAGTSTAFSALASLKPLLRARPDDERDSARALLFKVEAVAQLKGLARTDRLENPHPFISQTLTTLANAADAEHFALWVHQAIHDRRARHARVIGFWNSLADAAPAVGMGGTIIGLIGMFAQMSDPDTIGPYMALALMTTLHGLILANAIAGPIANRLAALSEREIAWQQDMADRMIAIARREGSLFQRTSMREVA